VGLDSSSNLTRPADAKAIRWLFTGKAAAALAANADASGLLVGTEPFVFSGPLLKRPPGDWKASLVRSFTSFKAIRSALSNNALSTSGVSGVMYDYEKWRFTPDEEKQNPTLYVKQAADLVHAQGLLFLAAPSIDLVLVQAPDADRKLQDETYLRLGIAADAARYADVVDIQAQQFEPDTQRYAKFVRAAAAQARGENPKVIVLAGVSTQPGGQHVTADDILGAIDATRDVVDGYWLNIPKPSEYTLRVTEYRMDIAVDVLRRLAGRQGLGANNGA
jgi:hypothetical protein